MKITASIEIEHPEPGVIAKSIKPDNTDNIRTGILKDKIIIKVSADRIGSVIATLDDLLANIKIADDSIKRV